MNFKTESKVADSIYIGMKYNFLTFAGMCKFEITDINEKFESATSKTGSLEARLKKREDGWYQPHVVYNPEVFLKIKS